MVIMKLFSIICENILRILKIIFILFKVKILNVYCCYKIKENVSIQLIRSISPLLGIRKTYINISFPNVFLYAMSIIQKKVKHHP